MSSERLQAAVAAYRLALADYTQAKQKYAALQEELRDAADRLTNADSNFYTAQSALINAAGEPE